MTLLLVFTGSVLADAHLTRQDAWVGENIKKVALAFENGPRFVAAVKRANNKMKLFSFTTFAGQLAELDSLPFSVSISEIKITYSPIGDRDFFITASRKENGQLRLDLIELHDDGALERVDKLVHVNMNVTNHISLASLGSYSGSNRFVVAAKEPSGLLDQRGYEHDGNQISWKTAEGGQSIERVAVQINAGSLEDRVIVGVRAPNNDLKVLVFKSGAPWWGDLNFAGNNVQSGYPAGAIESVNMPNTYPGNDIITAVQDSQDKLKLIRWTESCPYNGPSYDDCDLIRLEEGSAGAASNIRIAEAPNIKNRDLTTHKTSNGDLRVIAWRHNNGIIQNVGSNLTGNEPLGPRKRPLWDLQSRGGR
ncbi:MAG: hypothetical protein QNJ78_05850 [Gammaproteobacteria bacterium]|nr:hypothetical protein [Gammaproteobacteria bacterium]